MHTMCHNWVGVRLALIDLSDKDVAHDACNSGTQRCYRAHGIYKVYVAVGPHHNIRAAESKIQFNPVFDKSLIPIGVIKNHPLCGLKCIHTGGLLLLTWWPSSLPSVYAWLEASGSWEEARRWAKSPLKRREKVRNPTEKEKKKSSALPESNQRHFDY